MAQKTRQSGGRKTKKRAKSARGGSSGSGNGKNLVIVESPAKARTINRYLGNDYVVKASMGHVRDLPKSDIGVDIEHGFAPTYEPLSGRRKVLAELRKLARSAPNIFLATDLDREGEAIAWHLAEALGVKDEKLRRVIFNEITRPAIQDAFRNPRGIDPNKVHAQQARRILDRIVGYKISPLLWKKVAAGLSAGRVQSVAVRLIVDREREIDAFEPEEYWKIAAVFTPRLDQAGPLADAWREFLAREDDRGQGPTRDAQQEFLAEQAAFRAELVRWKGERFKAGEEARCVDVAKALGLNVENVERSEDPKAKGPARNQVTVVGRVGEDRPEYRVQDLRQRETRSRPPAPFTTATMQQTASVRLRFSASRTMRLAQQLYEGMEVPGEGSVGLITYMRTDSTQLSKEAVAQVRAHIAEQYGDAYLPDKPRTFAARERAQEAHEAIRPTDATRTPEKLRGTLDDAQFKLYQLIWKRFVSCQMNPAVWKVTEADIVAKTPAGEGHLKALGRTLAFDGYLRVMGLPRGGEQILPPLEKDQPVAPIQLDPTQHFTQPPPRYTEASLVKALEAEGIGRPSTYAAIIQTIQDRGYVEQLNRSFQPTDLGMVVTDKLLKHFPKIMDVHFTAHMEDELDRVEDAEADWVRVLEDFYGPFAKNLERAGENMIHAKREEKPSDYTCEKCGQPMVYKFSKNGRYLACSGYPDCQNTMPVDREGKPVGKTFVDVLCPKCEGRMTLRKGRYGPFLSCSRYPDCDGVVNIDRKGFVKHPSPPPLEIPDVLCPKCDAPTNLRRSKRGPWLSCSKYPKCRGRVGFKGLPDEKRAELEKRLAEHEAAHPQPTLKTVFGEPVGDEHKPQEVSEQK